MKITGINIPENFFDKGLDKINIDRLGDIVILAGKNGLGKTRLLDTIFYCVNTQIMTTRAYEGLPAEIQSYENGIKNFPNTLLWNIIKLICPV